MNSISVIIPTFNRKKLLERALSSVFKQTLQPDEILVIDNGSTDGTVEMLSNKYPNVICIEEIRNGVSAARNAGVLKAKSQWIAFLDSDDVWHPKKLETQRLEYYQSGQRHRLIHTNELWYKNNIILNQKLIHEKKGGKIFFDCLIRCCISPSSSLIKAEVFSELGFFKENLLVCEDYDFWLRITARESVLYINQPLTIKHGGHFDQLSKKFWGMDRFRVMALEDLLNESKLPSEYRRATFLMLFKKIDILISGGIKRSNQKLVDNYSKKKHYFTACYAQEFGQLSRLTK